MQPGASHNAEVLHRLLQSDTAYVLNWNELMLLFIAEIMTSIVSLIFIIGANLHKLQRFTSFQFNYHGTWSEEHVSSKKLLDKFYLHLANLNCLFCACAVID